MSSALAFTRNPLFARVSTERLARLAGTARSHRYDRGFIIFQEGDRGTDLYMIVGGRVKISQSSVDGKERTLALLGPGEVFGELALLDGGPRSAAAVVAEDAELLVVPREEFLAFIGAQPEAAMSLLVLLSRRLRSADRLLHDAAFFDVRGRLARVLLELAGADPTGGPDAPPVCPQMTQSELASVVGVTRESVNKWLRHYERQGTVARRGGRLVILDGQRLAADVNGLPV